MTADSAQFHSLTVNSCVAHLASYCGSAACVAVQDGFDVERGSKKTAKKRRSELRVGLSNDAQQNTGASKGKKLSKQASAGLSSDTIQAIARQKGVFEGESGGKKVSKGATNEATKAISAAEGGFKCTDLMHEHSSWEKAVKKNEGVCTGSCAGLVACLRLIAWHLLTPIVFLLFLGLLHGDIDMYQRIFAALVGVRMLVSIVFTLICTKVNPAFLLVDVAASVKQRDTIPQWDGGETFLCVYLFAPEKYVMFALFDSGGLDLHDSLISMAFASMAVDSEYICMPAVICYRLMRCLCVVRGSHRRNWGNYHRDH
jgi:hypothetical protein